MTEPQLGQNDAPRFWGDPVEAHEPPGSRITISTMHEGVLVVIERPDRTTHAFVGSGKARLLADSLLKAAAKWEED